MTDNTTVGAALKGSPTLLYQAFLVSMMITADNAQAHSSDLPAQTDFPCGCSSRPYLRLEKTGKTVILLFSCPLHQPIAVDERHFALSSKSPFGKETPDITHLKHPAWLYDSLLFSSHRISQESAGDYAAWRKSLRTFKVYNAHEYGNQWRVAEYTYAGGRRTETKLVDCARSLSQEEAGKAIATFNCLGKVCEDWRSREVMVKED